MSIFVSRITKKNCGHIVVKISQSIACGEAKAARSWIMINVSDCIAFGKLFP